LCHSSFTWHYFLRYGFFLQPAFLVAVFAAKESTDLQHSNANDVKQPTNEASFEPQGSKKSSLVDALLHHLDRTNDLINRYIVLKGFYSSFFVRLFIVTMYCYILLLLFDMIDMVTSYLGFTF
jgi:hypothetical protein